MMTSSSYAIRLLKRLPLWFINSAVYRWFINSGVVKWIIRSLTANETYFEFSVCYKLLALMFGGIERVLKKIGRYITKAYKAAVLCKFAQAANVAISETHTVLAIFFTGAAVAYAGVSVIGGLTLWKAVVFLAFALLALLNYVCAINKKILSNSVAFKMISGLMK